MFLRDNGDKSTAALLVRAYDSRPSNLCYLHFLHGGGTANDVRAEDTAFGCREWTYVCVITGGWPREEDSRSAGEAKEWVYRVANDLLPLSIGVYGADLGPDPRDIALAQKAFGPNLTRLSRLKRTLDPLNVLVYELRVPSSKESYGTKTGYPRHWRKLRRQRLLRRNLGVCLYHARHGCARRYSGSQKVPFSY